MLLLILAAVFALTAYASADEPATLSFKHYEAVNAAKNCSAERCFVAYNKVDHYDPDAFVDFKKELRNGYALECPKYTWSSLGRSYGLDKFRFCQEPPEARMLVREFHKWHTKCDANPPRFAHYTDDGYHDSYTRVEILNVTFGSPPDRSHGDLFERVLDSVGRGQLSMDLFGYSIQFLDEVESKPRPWRMQASYIAPNERKSFEVFIDGGKQPQPNVTIVTLCSTSESGTNITNDTCLDSWRALDNGVKLRRVPDSKLEDMISLSPTDQACVPLRVSSGLRFLICRKVDPSSPFAFSDESTKYEKEAREKESLKAQCGCEPSYKARLTRAPEKIVTKFTNDWIMFAW